MVETAFWFDNWPWLILSAVSAYLAYFIVKFIRIRRFYKGLVSIYGPKVNQMSLLTASKAITRPQLHTWES
jgi:hypothetical protein